MQGGCMMKRKWCEERSVGAKEKERERKRKRGTFTHLLIALPTCVIIVVMLL